MAITAALLRDIMHVNVIVERSRNETHPPSLPGVCESTVRVMVSAARVFLARLPAAFGRQTWLRHDVWRHPARRVRLMKAWHGAIGCDL
jgi:hypothetical protein